MALLYTLGTSTDRSVSVAVPTGTKVATTIIVNTSQWNCYTERAVRFIVSTYGDNLLEIIRRILRIFEARTPHIVAVIVHFISAA